MKKTILLLIILIGIIPKGITQNLKIDSFNHKIYQELRRSCTMTSYHKYYNNRLYALFEDKKCNYFIMIKNKKGYYYRKYIKL